MSTMENADAIASLDLAIRITKAERTCDRELDIPIGSTIVGYQPYENLASDEKLPWATYNWLGSIMGWLNYETRGELLHLHLKHLGWPVVRVLPHGRDRLAGYVSIANTHEDASKDDTIHWKVDFIRALELCKQVATDKITNRTEAIQFLLDQPKIESGIGFASGGMVPWARIGNVYDNGPIHKTAQEAELYLPRVRIAVIREYESQRGVTS